MNEPLNVWNIIDTYFRDNIYYKTQHHIDSFNEFVFSEKNGIRHIIKRQNPLLIYKEEKEGSFLYEIKIFFGETLEENPESGDYGGIKRVDENIFISSPAEITGGESKFMYPNVARLKGYTYGSNIFCNVGVIFIDNEKNKSTVINYPKINIGTIPIMVHSKMCILNGLDSTQLKTLGECPYDQGGYFIVKGKEKIIISQEDKVNNILYITPSPEDGIILQGAIKSVSNEGYQSSRTNHIYLTETKINVKKSYKVNRLLVRILGLEIKVPLFILLKALGMKNDKEILSHIIYSEDSPDIKSNMMNILRYAVKDSEPVYTQTSAFMFMSVNTKGKEIINVIDLLNNNLLPHYKDHKQKAYFLAYSTRKILLTHLGILPTTDRDSYANKHVDLSGSLLLELFRELWGNYLKNTSLTIDHEYKFNFKKGEVITNVINESNYKRVFNSTIMDRVTKSFGAMFGTGLSARQGIVQDLNRLSALGTLSHIRRLSFPLPSGSKTIGPRKLHNSQWGFVCPSDSPDGGNTGIINHLSIMAKVSSNINAESILDALKDLNYIPLSSINTNDFNHRCKIFVNGKWVGIHYSPDILFKVLRLYKLNSIINIFTSIVWDTTLNELYISTTSGRIIRPTFVLRSDRTNRLIGGDLSLIKEWSRALHGYLYDILDTDVSIYDDIYHGDIVENLRSSQKDYLEFLESKQAVIEYIDPNESNNSLIARDYRSIDKDYTHCEIHSSLILSPVALNIPFPEHSQAPRNVFSCQQTKQAVGTYSTAYNTRFDTFGHILNYPQKALVTTRYKKYTHVDKMPYGVNCIVAIASYGGYNQEDAVIINKTSAERGMFQSVYFRSYEDSEESTNGVTSAFCNPKYQKNVVNTGTKNFDKLDDNGFIKENVLITEDDVFSCKCTSVNTENGEMTKLTGGTIKKNTYGIVDKVVVYENKGGLRTCKVRLRKNRSPEIGDKFSSRPGQKGVCGMLLSQEDMPYSKDGIVPDLIVNPHAIPSRMTVNQLLEMILGKSSSMGGYLGDATPFQNNDINDYTKVLEGYGYEGNGNEVMYSGITGEQIHTSIFMGPIYYQRLKIMVADKVHSRATGRMNGLVRQPVGGRAAGGGFRVGEMERDSIISHGISKFLSESMMERSDKYEIQIDENTGLIDHTENNSEKVSVELPYAMKLLLQELQTMSISPRIITDTSIQNPTIFKHMTNEWSAKNAIVHN
jgi:DNA-directed RNA polymerase II subunit RPB2